MYTAGEVCVGDLPTWGHSVEGRLCIIDESTMVIRDFQYDSGGPGQLIKQIHCLYVLFSLTNVNFRVSQHTFQLYNYMSVGVSDVMVVVSCVGALRFLHVV